MKNFLSLKRLRKSINAPKRVKLAPSEIFKMEDTYPVYISYAPADKTAAYYVKALEEAHRVFEEAPPPEFILKRMRGLE